AAPVHRRRIWHRRQGLDRDRDAQRQREGAGQAERSRAAGRSVRQPRLVGGLRRAWPQTARPFQWRRRQHQPADPERSARPGQRRNAAPVVAVQGAKSLIRNPPPPPPPLKRGCPPPPPPNTT